MTSLTTSLRLLTSALAMSLAMVPAWAEQSAPVLTLELNAAQPSDKGCRLTFLVSNNLGADLIKAAFEIALFNEAGIVDRLTVLDFKDLPAGKTKVTRFDLAGTDCTKVSRVLINSATECAGTGVEPAACMRKLKTDTRTGIAFGV
ncbi:MULTISPECIES: hypothetical protein [unclassified Mesorhizobium]|uniref:hypothetical protein n=1 Tax=unclassified Mesorhizobium TaxID=325217 RepID=UPI000FCA8238|nr:MULTISPECIES: hypothetical protein [unclassified Mesorhizobium]RUX00009.1 hypothetical protein EOA30_22805 [Mesorhizobium sp. M8A.F.Ca.ET.059.01.1.1]TGW07887.1 hypothetical protein EN788_34265 [Mesorhizobium sp. M2D.F.Ca.ET.145.01.1.1]RUW49781.1 hypothetical protein EOA36_17935 [Mesorhizobium sp. M8A.F.Ca.ET.021.01.1.1]TGT85323.1 hypothetical protein EN804_22615 [Mesorhizobium sp. M8A.F.Ca.ET.161.01.1.1]TGV39268.1 hypothetical protein EN785_22600 [Mesorhizobium sp. M8A.F.Ca.ET.142.01.1.1]